jgi:hypothetical protein
MKSAGLLRDMFVACALVALAAAAAGAATGHVGVGLGLAAGLMLGSLNGYLLQGLMDRGTPFAASGIFRILLFSSFALIAVLTLRSIAWTVPLGIGLAQLVMVGVALRRGLRAR